MEKIVRDMIALAEEREDNELATLVKDIIDKFAVTANCPSNWRDIGEDLAREYGPETWVHEELELWNHEEG